MFYIHAFRTYTDGERHEIISNHPTREEAEAKVAKLESESYTLDAHEHGRPRYAITGDAVEPDDKEKATRNGKPKRSNATPDGAGTPDGGNGANE